MKRKPIPVSLILALCFFLAPVPPSLAASQGKTIEKDTDQDGVVDMIQVYGPRGDIREVHMDSDKNGTLERVQFYKDEALVRVERDVDDDEKPDVFDYFKETKRVRQERKDTRGRTTQIVLFDENEAPKVLKKDTTGSGFFDRVYSFDQGHVARMTSDGNENGRINVTVLYAHDLPSFKSVDDNEDGHNEVEITYDKEGQPLSSRHDRDTDSVMDTFRTYDKGLIVKQEEDRDQNGVMDRVITFHNGIPHNEDKDSNLDKTMDRFIAYDAKGEVSKIREDSRYTGHIDRIRTFNAGKPVKTVYDTDGDRFLETVYVYKNGKLHLQTKDENKDGSPDIRIFFGENELKKRLESDTDYNGQTDLVMFFDKGAKIRSEKDADGDSYFETRQHYNRPGWSLVTETDRNANRVFESRFSFKDGVLRKREIDENEDNTPDFIEYLKPDGKLERSEERNMDTGRIGLVWLYDESEFPWCAQQDLDGDGHFETSFYYENNRVTKVEEDTNNDGNPDVWETYDEAEVLVATRRDLDYDGVADLLKDKTGSHPLLAVQEKTIASGGPPEGPNFENPDKQAGM